MSGRKWENAHNDTDAHIARMAGLAAVLRAVTMDWGPLNSPDPVAYGILSLIQALDDDMRKLEDMRSEEWQLRQQAEVGKAA